MYLDLIATLDWADEDIPIVDWIIEVAGERSGGESSL